MLRSAEVEGNIRTELVRNLSTALLISLSNSSASSHLFDIRDRCDKSLWIKRKDAPEHREPTASEG